MTAEKITIEPRRVNYESDFDFMLWFVREGPDGEPERFFPDYDFTGVLSSGRRFLFSRKGGRYVNCRREGDGLRVVCDNHGMAPGGVWLKVVAELPDGIYPDGFRREVSNAPSGIELVRGSGDGPTEMEVALTVPFVFRSAYDMAVDAGFEGTEDDFRRATAMMPAAVDVLRQVGALTSDWAEGRERIASSLRAQGVDASATDSFDALADKVRGLRLAPEADPVAVSPRQYGGRQTLLEFMHNNRRAGFPGMVGVELYGLTDNLHGADAYLCSDGYDSAEGGEHEFAEEHSTHYVIHYYAKEDYQVPTYDKCAGMIVLGGRPALPAFGASNMAYFHTYDCKPVMTGTLMTSNILRELILHGLEENPHIIVHSDGYLSFIDLPDLRVARNRIIFWEGRLIEALYFPCLEEINTTDNVIDQWRNGIRLEAPRLKSITRGTLVALSASIPHICLPALQSLNGTVASNCAALTEIELPSLETMTGGTVASNCAALTEIELPNLIELGNATIASGCYNIKTIRLPNLLYRRVIGDNGFFSAGINSEVDIYVPKLKYYVANVGINWFKDNVILHIHLGNIDGGNYRFTDRYDNTNMTVDVLPGFRSTLDISHCLLMTAENLAALIANLGDNNGNATLTLTLGAANIAKLDEDTIALAQAKNYTIV